MPGDLWAFAGMLDSVATVYSRASGTGLATVVARDNLPVRISHVAPGDASGIGRAELAATRQLLWTDDYAMPPDAVVELNHDGRRWNVRPETVRNPKQPDGKLAHWECELVGPPRAPEGTVR